MLQSVQHGLQQASGVDASIDTIVLRFACSDCRVVACSYAHAASMRREITRIERTNPQLDTFLQSVQSTFAWLIRTVGAP